MVNPDVMAQVRAMRANAQPAITEATRCYQCGKGAALRHDDRPMCMPCYGAPLRDVSRKLGQR